jgi:hypothetical protein
MYNNPNPSRCIAYSYSLVIVKLNRGLSEQCHLRLKWVLHMHAYSSSTQYNVSSFARTVIALVFKIPHRQIRHW